MVGRDGFLGSIFDEVLVEISSETNKILSSIPNTSHMTLNLRSERLTQKGTIEKGIVPVIAIGGHEAPFESGCSGGMRSAVELAVDLAVATVISRRTGVVPGWLVLDECFEGLGVCEKEACLQILGSYADDKLILVVDHSSETKEAFSQFIDVEYRDGVSMFASS
jgi:DNA repair exonuclease SbcCD ATPase subunit